MLNLSYKNPLNFFPLIKEHNKNANIMFQTLVKIIKTEKPMYKWTPTYVYTLENTSKTEDRKSAGFHKRWRRPAKVVSSEWATLKEDLFSDKGRTRTRAELFESKLLDRGDRKDDKDRDEDRLSLLRMGTGRWPGNPMNPTVLGIYWDDKHDEIPPEKGHG